MISKLTDKQWENILRKRDEHLKIHLSTEEADFGDVEKSIIDIYKIMGKDRPKVIFYLNSPMSCQLAINLFKGKIGSQLYSQLDSQLGSQLYSQLDSQLRSQLYSQLDSQLDSQLYSQLDSQLRSQLDSQLYSQLYSQLDSQLSSQKLDFTSSTTDYFWRGHYSYYQILIEEVFPNRINDFPLLQTMLQFFKNCPVTYLFDEIAFVSKAPKTKWLDQRLHNEQGMSVEFQDGWGFYSLNGIVVDEYFVKTPKNDIDTKKVLALENAEQRMSLIKYIGMDKFLSSFNNRLIESEETYDLVDIEIEEEYCRFLKMKNPSTGEFHVEGVPNECMTINEALAWRNGLEIEDFIRPSILT